MGGRRTLNNEHYDTTFEWQGVAVPPYLVAVRHGARRKKISPQVSEFTEAVRHNLLFMKSRNKRVQQTSQFRLLMTLHGGRLSLLTLARIQSTDSETVANNLFYSSAIWQCQEKLKIVERVGKEWWTPWSGCSAVIRPGNGRFRYQIRNSLHPPPPPPHMTIADTH